jgi:cobalt transporter subunit CbtB
MPMSQSLSVGRNTVTVLGAAGPAVFALLFGVFIIFGVGFAGPMVLHNAAHDVRHAFAFPCH